MPLVFVHGVNVRHGELYNRELAFRNRHFAEVLYPQLGRRIAPESILNPYWGDLGATLSADAPYLPHGEYEMLWRKQLSVSAENAAVTIEKNSEPESNAPLLEMARKASFSELVDLIWDYVDQELMEAGGDADTVRDADAMAQHVLNFSQSEEGVRWLNSIKTDDELLERLDSYLSNGSGGKISDQKRKGIANRVKAAGKLLQKRISDARQSMSNKSKSFGERIQEDFANARFRIREKTVSTTARIFNQPLRALFHQQCALLIGDSFSYFSGRGDSSKAAPIAERVIESLQQASELKKQKGGELVVIGHSMGGVILCDIVTCYGKDIPIDVLITVGSQFPLFADLNMFHGIPASQRPIPKPENVKHWINIFDPHDFLGYPASHMFSGVSDFHVPTYAVGASTHTDYFNRRSFYFQLARRLSDYFAAIVK